MSIRFSISSSDFIESFQEKQPLLMRSAASTEVFSWRDVNEIFERSDITSKDFKLSCDGIRPKEEYVESYLDVGTLRYRLIKSVVYDYLRRGATLIANKITNEPKVHVFSKRIADFTGRRVVSSAYAAFGIKDSFRCHWDTRDVFAIQLIGRKRWTLYQPTLELPLYSQQSRDYEHLYPCPTEAYLDVILEAGDVLYVPRGWWHNPLPLGEGSFHLALGTFPAYAVDYLSWALNQMSDFLPTRLSLGDWEHDESTVADIGRHVAAFLSNRENYGRFMDAFVGTTRVESPLAIEMFGNVTASNINENIGLRLATDMHRHQLPGSYVLANGIKLNLSEQSQRLVRCIATTPGVTLADLVIQLADLDAHKLRQLVTELCRQDVLELVRQ
ncbi:MULTISPECIES: JmjC domain-containing protein [Burkholderia]|uniref:JmjC domain-containing protein n=1 Tax=Burkholderia TaxID=32008 RepID=UPI00265DB44D|nr:cupin domain-containing protein [Burkholderia sp. AU44665]MDN7703355.1 cupin domain-containing protein [Burkholderia sp. AU44665]